MDGTSGALYSIWLNALAAGLTRGAKEESTSSASSSTWAKGLSYALSILFEYTAARRPSRTLVDPLQTFTETYAKADGANLDEAIKAAVKAAEETKDLVAKAGRAAYVGREQLQEAQVPDPGAWGVAELLQGFQSAL
jgi:dihydroxyacetone kinase